MSEKDLIFLDDKLYPIFENGKEVPGQFYRIVFGGCVNVYDKPILAATAIGGLCLIGGMIIGSIYEKVGSKILHDRETMQKSKEL